MAVRYPLPMRSLAVNSIGSFLNAVLMSRNPGRCNSLF